MPCICIAFWQRLPDCGVPAAFCLTIVVEKQLVRSEDNVLVGCICHHYSLCLLMLCLVLLELWAQHVQLPLPSASMHFCGMMLGLHAYQLILTVKVSWSVTRGLSKRVCSCLCTGCQQDMSRARQCRCSSSWCLNGSGSVVYMAWLALVERGLLLAS